VIVALVLRDIKSRFGGKSANYIIAIAWPLGHMGVLIALYTFMGRPAPVGDSAPLFFATGLLPFILFNYPSRLMMQSVMTNAPLLNFPVVTPLDIILARAVLEAVTSFGVILVFGLILFAMDVNIIPRDPGPAVAALGAALFVSISIGVVNCVITTFVRLWLFPYILIVIVLYLMSGILFVPELVPEKIRDWLVWNPVLHMIEWFRSGYYENYGRQTLDRGYLLVVGLCALSIGLTAERATRRFASY
jgi:capsular polysaccharide transport system permease protein